jgi:filamentous hemagglutinin family protein
MFIKNSMLPRPAWINDLQPVTLKSGVFIGSPGRPSIEPALARLSGEGAAFSWPPAAIVRFVLAVGMFSVTTVVAQIRTDASLGQAAQTLSGPTYRIPETLGKLAGNNLFHSFQSFSVRNGEVASFSTVTPTIAHVISRVTGGEISQIDGKIQLNSLGARPDFYFINPAGVVFGAEATLDVPGAFMVATADSVKFPDGRFNADLNRSSTFSSAAPEAFGFLGTTRGTITLKEGAILATQSIRPLSLVAGDIEINGASVSSTKGGDIRIAALGQSSQDVAFTGDLPAAAGNLAILKGGLVTTSNTEQASSGNIIVSAGKVSIDSLTSGQLTGLLSQAESDTATNAGDIRVSAGGQLSLAGDGVIASVTYGSGKSGTLRVEAGSAHLVGAENAADSALRGLLSLAVEGSSGDAGNVNLSVTGDCSLASYDSIASLTLASDSAGRAGNVAVTVNGILSITGGSSISSSTYSLGEAGNIKVSADRLVIDGLTSQQITGIFSDTNGNGSGHAGNIDIAAHSHLSIVNGGMISTDTYSFGHAGDVNVRAGSITVDGQQGRFASISSSARGDGVGHAGNIDVTANSGLLIANGGMISTDTWSSGDAGNVNVSAGSIAIDGRGAFLAYTGISSDALEAGKSGTGKAGNVNVTTSGSLSIMNGEISSLSGGYGDAGNVKVTADTITIDRYGGGVSGIHTDADLYLGLARAGNVDVTASGNISLFHRSQISSNTYTPGNAGTVRVSAGNLVVLNESFISSDTYSSGNAGSVDISVADKMLIGNSGVVSSSTGDSGKAGSVRVDAGMLRVDGEGSSINASAQAGSSGQTGSVNVTAQTALILANGADLSIRNAATVSGTEGLSPTLLIVSSPHITLNNAQISAASTGNVAASDIQINASRQLFVERSRIVTSANLGNGGAIGLYSDGVVTLTNAQVTTSVAGDKGNGGDIAVNSAALVMNTGFIQANTAADHATGGKVGIDVQMLLTSGNTLFVGGQQPLSFAADVFGLNVIQAAAPTGVSGSIQMTSPVLDLSGSLSGLNAQLLETGGLGRSPCQSSGGSSLAQSGRGGLPPSARGLLRAEPQSQSQSSFSQISASPAVRRNDGHLALFQKVCL